MIKNNFKAILFAALIVAMILPFSVMDISAAPTENANDKAKGKLFIKDKNDNKVPHQDEMNKMFKVVKDKNSSKDDKDKAGKRMDEIRQLTKSLAPKISHDKTQKIRGQIDNVALAADKIAESENVWIVSIGTDYENQSVNVGIEREGLTDQKIKKIEKKLRGILGNDVDITISYADPIYLTSCSQTGDCNPVEGGTRISVDGHLCSMGYRATIGTATGFVTAGHCNAGATGVSVGQPTMLDVLGTVILNDFQNGTWCDCTFVESTETTSPDVYNGQTVSGFVFPTLYDWVELEGTISLGSQGAITDVYEHIHPRLPPSNNYYWVYGVVQTSASAIGGDSGGSVIESTSGTPGFMGIITAGNSTETFYTPYYRITNAFTGITLG